MDGHHAIEVSYSALFIQTDVELAQRGQKMGLRRRNLQPGFLSLFTRSQVLEDTVNGR